MSKHSVAEAKNKLPELIDRALKGEEVVITRHGHPVVELKSVNVPVPKILTDSELDWLANRRVGRVTEEDAGTLVSRMRDEDWPR